MLQKRPEDKEEVKEKIKEKDISEMEAEAEKLVKNISTNTEIIKNKVKEIVSQKIPTKSEIVDKNKEKTITEEKIIQKLIKTYKWAYKENLYPWMYWIPEKDKDIESWLDEWSDFLFDWAKEFVLHIVDLYDLATKRPFNALQDRDKALQKIFGNLAKNSKFARWINDEKTRLRIYWQSLDKWGDDLYDWAFLIGEERLTLLDLREMGSRISKGFETLPARDLREIVDLLVKKKKAVWIDKKSFKFLFDI